MLRPVDTPREPKVAETVAASDGQSRVSPPRWFWIASALGLVWNLIGVAAFVAQMGMDLSQLSAAERAFYEDMPAWAIAAYGLAVFSGCIGCLALLLRKSWALPMLLLCLAGIIVQIFHSVFVGGGLELFGPEGLVLPAAVLVIALLLTWLAHHASRQGWMS
jgi:hypothetical protein